MPLAPDQQLFEYRIERALGRGAFGVVCQVYNTPLTRPVAGSKGCNEPIALSQTPLYHSRHSCPVAACQHERWLLGGAEICTRFRTRSGKHYDRRLL